MQTNTSKQGKNFQEARNSFIDVFKKQSASYREVVEGTAFPESFPFQTFPLDKLQEFAMYHRMKTGWKDWMEEQFPGEPGESYYFVEGANWGEWERFVARIRTALFIGFQQYFGIWNIKLDNFFLKLSYELTEILKDKSPEELRLNSNDRDYQLAVIRISSDQIQSLTDDLEKLVSPLVEIHEAVERMNTFASRLKNFIKKSKETIYHGDYNDIRTLDNIIRESNQLTTDYKDLSSGELNVSNFISEVYVSYNEGKVSVSLLEDPVAENNPVPVDYNLTTDPNMLESNIEFLKELTHMTRKEKESFESNRMNKSLFRLQIIMTISLFTSAAALFTVSMSQVKSNWDIVLILLGFSVVFTLGTYFFVAKR